MENSIDTSIKNLLTLNWDIETWEKQESEYKNKEG